MKKSAIAEVEKSRRKQIKANKRCEKVQRQGNCLCTFFCLAVENFLSEILSKNFAFIYSFYEYKYFAFLFNENNNNHI